MVIFELAACFGQLIFACILKENAVLYYKEKIFFVPFYKKICKKSVAKP